MHSFAAAGAAFLICVLWFDLMFDTQVRGHDGDLVPEAALVSISGYYRGIARAWPMNRLVAVVMLGTVLVIVMRLFSARITGGSNGSRYSPPSARSDSRGSAPFLTPRAWVRLPTHPKSNRGSRAESTRITSTV